MKQVITVLSIIGIAALIYNGLTKQRTQKINLTK